MIGAVALAVEKGSKDANAAPRPTSFPFGIFWGGRGVRIIFGLGVELTSADQDLGGGLDVGD